VIGINQAGSTNPTLCFKPSVEWAGGSRARTCCGLLDLRAMRSIVLETYINTRIYVDLPSPCATGRPQPPPPIPSLTVPLPEERSQNRLKKLSALPPALFLPTDHPCVRFHSHVLCFVFTRCRAMVCVAGGSTPHSA
jgi:hypothetical protein